jgi:hypothetical protein
MNDQRYWRKKSKSKKKVVKKSFPTVTSAYLKTEKVTQESKVNVHYTHRLVKYCIVYTFVREHCMQILCLILLFEIVNDKY